MKFCFLEIFLISSVVWAQGNEAGPPSAPPPPSTKPTPPPVPSELLGTEAPATEPTNAPPPSVPATTQPSTPEYTYDPTGRRDPFMIHKSFQKKGIVSGGGTKKTEQNIEILDPLIKIDLDKLEIVGIIWEVANPRALIMDQGDLEHKVHIISKRTKIGRNNGYVAAIREGEIVIIETFEEAGIVNQQPRVIKLQAGK